MEGLHALFSGIERIGVRWMLGGSVGAMCYSEPRATLDIDCVLALSCAHVQAVVVAFPESEFYVPPAAVIEHEIRRGAAGSFNIIHHESGFKADCYPSGQDELMRWGLAASRQLPVDGRVVPVAPPEYIVCMKLRFFAMSGQDKHLRDIRALVRMTSALDQDMISHWASRYGVADAWRLARS